MLRSIASARRRLLALSSIPKKIKPVIQPVTAQPTIQCITTHHAFLRPSMRYFSTSIRRQAIVPFKLHDIGEGITEVEMLSWKVVVGQRVEHFDDLCEVQSDKSTAELTSPTPGIVRSINVKEGDTVKVGQTLCEIQTEEEGGEEESERSEHRSDKGSGSVEEVPEPTQMSSPVSSTNGNSPNAEAQIEVENTKGQEKEGIEVEHREEPTISDTSVQFTGEASILPSAPLLSHQTFTGPVPVRREREQGVLKKIILSSPATRSLAGRLGIDLSLVHGTGDKGRITKDDIQKYHAINRGGNRSNGQDATPKMEGTAAPSAPSGNRATWQASTKVEFGRTRKVMYRALGAQAEVPHFGYSHTLDLTNLLPYLKTHDQNQSKTKPGYIASDIPTSLAADPLDGSREKTTLLSFLIKGLLLAMEENPIMRAKVVGKGEERHLEIKRDGTIGVAVSDPKYGLVTPSLPSLPPSTSISEITTHLSTLRKNPTKPGPTSNLVISSVGGLGESTGAMPVIPPGGPLAICAVGRARWEMEWNLRDQGLKVDREAVERAGYRAVLKCAVGWSGDHRVLEGAELISFTESWKKYIEEPWRWIKVA